MYDVTERRSFHNVNVWLEQLKEHGDSRTKIILVGNKCDVPEDKRQVSFEEGDSLAKQIGCSFVEASAKMGVNVNEAFEILTTEAKDM